MAQRLKDEVRVRILASAASEFAKCGYEGARIAVIAKSAEISPSNVYRYFKDKQVLFDAVVTPDLAPRLMLLVQVRIQELANFGDWRHANSNGSSAAAALLEFWVENRLETVIILKSADDTPLAGFRQLLVRDMIRIALGKQENSDDSAFAGIKCFILDQILNHTLDTIAAILEQYEVSADIEAAVLEFWTFQLAGLKGLFEVPLVS